MATSDSSASIEFLTRTAQEKANLFNIPFLVCWAWNGARLVRAVEYRHELHGAVERVRYPRGYRHPPPSSSKRW